MKDGPDPLERAVELARSEPVDPLDWEDVAGSVMRRVRATVRPGRRIGVPLPWPPCGARSATWTGWPSRIRVEVSVVVVDVTPDDPRW